MLKASVGLAAVFCAFLLVGEAELASAADEEEHFLDFSVDNYKVSLISGNLTSSVTYEWPRIVFSHSSDPFAPTFELSLPKLFVFNDTDSDGLFDKEEALHIGFLDELHLAWNRPTVEFFNMSDNSEVSQIKMNTTISLFESAESDYPDISNWANMTVYYTIYENSSSMVNSYGRYWIQGGIEMAFNFTLDILRPVESSGIVLEQDLQGGGSTYLFTLAQAECDGALVYTTINSRVDEEGIVGTNYTHRFGATSSPRQEIYFVKDNMTRQAYYMWDSEPLKTINGSVSLCENNASYYTTGTGLTLHTSYFVPNGTQRIHQEGSIGIIESGFGGRIRDWVVEHLGYILIITGTAILVVSLALFYRIVRGRHKDLAEKKDETREEGRSKD